MEQKIGIIVNPLKTLGEFCKKHQLKIIYKLVLSTVGQFSSPAILNYRLIVYQKNGKIYKSVIGSGKGVTSAQENAAYKLLRMLGKSEFHVDIESFSEQKNAVTALTNYTKAMQNSTTPQFEITLSEMDQRIFLCKCTIAGISCQAEASNKYAAKQRAAFLVLHQIEMNDLKRSIDIPVASAHALQSPTPMRRQKRFKFDASSATSYQQFESNGFAATRIDFVDTIETQNLVKSIDEFLNAVCLNELNCTTEEYLSTTNYWRLPCKLTVDVNQMLIHEILYELEKCFGIKDIKPTTSFLINMKNVIIDEGWANISKTPYEFRVWTPCFLDDYNTLELSDRFEISVCSDESVTNLYSPKIGESLILRHNTKFKLAGPKHVGHFYFVSEWKRNGIDPTNHCDWLNCDLLVDSKKYQKIKDTLRLGLEKLRRVYFQYELIEYVDEWLRILDIYEDESILRPHMLIDLYIINVPLARQTLKSFRIFLKAKEHHGRNLTEKLFLKELDNHLLKPIANYTKRNVQLRLREQ